MDVPFGEWVRLSHVQEEHECLARYGQTLIDLGATWDTFAGHRPSGSVVADLVDSGIPLLTSRDIVTAVSGVVQAPVAVFWDIDCLPLSPAMTPKQSILQLRSMLAPYGRMASLSVYTTRQIASPKNSIFSKQTDPMWAQFRQSGCDIIDALVLETNSDGTETETISLSTMISVDVIKFACKQNGPLTICIITDAKRSFEFSYLAQSQRRLGTSKIRVVLVSNENEDPNISSRISFVYDAWLQMGLPQDQSVHSEPDHAVMIESYNQETNSWAESEDSEPVPVQSFADWLAEAGESVGSEWSDESRSLSCESQDVDKVTSEEVLVEDTDSQEHTSQDIEARTRESVGSEWSDESRSLSCESQDVKQIQVTSEEVLVEDTDSQEHTSQNIEEPAPEPPVLNTTRSVSHSEDAAESILWAWNRCKTRIANTFVLRSTFYCELLGECRHIFPNVSAIDELLAIGSRQGVVCEFGTGPFRLIGVGREIKLAVSSVVFLPADLSAKSHPILSKHYEKSTKKFDILVFKSKSEEQYVFSQCREVLGKGKVVKIDEGKSPIPLMGDEDDGKEPVNEISKDSSAIRTRPKDAAKLIFWAWNRCKTKIANTFVLRSIFYHHVLSNCRHRIPDRAAIDELLAIGSRQGIVCEFGTDPYRLIGMGRENVLSFSAVSFLPKALSAKSHPILSKHYEYSTSKKDVLVFKSGSEDKYAMSQCKKILGKGTVVKINKGKFPPLPTRGEDDGRRKTETEKSKDSSLESLATQLPETLNKSAKDIEPKEDVKSPIDFVTEMLETAAADDDFFLKRDFLLEYMVQRWPKECLNTVEASKWVDEAVNQSGGSVTEYGTKSDKRICLTEHFSKASNGYYGKADTSEEEEFVVDLLRKSTDGWIPKVKVIEQLKKTYPMMEDPGMRIKLFRNANEKKKFFLGRGCFGQTVGMDEQTAIANLKKIRDVSEVGL